MTQNVSAPLALARQCLDFYRLHCARMIGEGLAGFTEQTDQKNDATRTTVGETDIIMNQLLHEFFRRTFLLDILVGEEDQKTRGFLWPPGPLDNVTFFDPIDGTTNRKGGLSTFGSTFAGVAEGALNCAGVYLPYEDRATGNGFVFVMRGYGAWQWIERQKAFVSITGKRLPSKRMEVLVEGSTLKTARDERMMKLARTITTRSSVSSAWATAVVALGRWDGLVAFDNDPWDNLPIMTFAEELGLAATDPDGNPLTLANCRNIVIAQPEAHPAIIKALRA